MRSRNSQKERQQYGKKRKEKGQTMIYKALHRKLMLFRLKNDVNAVFPEKQ